MSTDGQVAFPKRRSAIGRIIRIALTLSFLGAITSVGAAAVFLRHTERTPREWAPYLQQRAEGHRPLIVSATDFVADWLIYADRLARSDASPLPETLGASAARSGSVLPAHLRLVSSMADLRGAVVAARPGDVIEILPGHYRLDGPPVSVSQSGTASAPITLRAATLGSVVIESDTVETFKVLAPFWRFENLTMRGICSDQTYCEHAFHIVGAATDTVIRNNRIEDYNAQVKINGEDGHWPDRGVIDGNTFTDTAPRITLAPVTPIDLVGASGWRVSGNVIADFVRGTQGQATYGGFFKGAGQNNVFERNLVVCEWKLRGMPGGRIGFSLGGGGTGEALRRDHGATGTEQVGAVIRNNLIAFCSDDGIYLNRSARSVVDHNTLLDTAGIDARFIETSASVTANIVDGQIHAREGAVTEERDNDRPLFLGLFAGWHPQRAYFRNPAVLDMTWAAIPTKVPTTTSAEVDLCGGHRGSQSPAGAFEDYSRCLNGQ